MPKKKKVGQRDDAANDDAAIKNSEKHRVTLLVNIWLNGGPPSGVAVYKKNDHNLNNNVSANNSNTVEEEVDVNFQYLDVPAKISTTKDDDVVGFAFGGPWESGELWLPMPNMSVHAELGQHITKSTPTKSSANQKKNNAAAGTMAVKEGDNKYLYTTFDLTFAGGEDAPCFLNFAYDGGSSGSEASEASEPSDGEVGFNPAL